MDVVPLSSQHPEDAQQAKTTRVIVWAEHARLGFVRAVVARAGFVVVAAGSPEKGKSGAVAQGLDCDRVDDLRQVLTESPCDLILIVSAGDFGAASEPSDAAAVLSAHKRGVKVVSLEPMPGSALELSCGWSGASGELAPADAVRFVPLIGDMRSFRDSVETREMFGPVRTLLVEACCRPEEGVLGAMLLRAAALVQSLLGEPVSVDAAFAPPMQGGMLLALPGETLRTLHGDITANYRFEDGRAAAIVVSDQSGRWSSNVMMLGMGGRFRIYDDGFEWVGMDGNKVDAHRQTSRRGQGTAVLRSVEAVALALTRIMDPAIPKPSPIDHAAVLAVSQAVLLSARTGSAERPATIRRMMEVG